MDIQISGNVKMLFKRTDLLSFFEEKEYHLYVDISLIFISSILICFQDLIFIFFSFHFRKLQKVKIVE